MNKLDSNLMPAGVPNTALEPKKKRRNPNVPLEVSHNLVDIEKRLATLKQLYFDADNTKILKKAEAEKTYLLEECKKFINEINKEKTEGVLSARYKYSSDFGEQADKEVNELEEIIHELERIPQTKTVDNIKPKNPDDGVVLPDKITEEEKLEEGEEGEPKTDDTKIAEIVPEAIDPDEPKEETGEAERIVKRRIRLGAVLTDSIEKNARDIASERMTADKDSLRGISGFFKKIWKHNWGAERNRVKEIEKIKNELAAVGSTFSPDDIDGLKDRAIKEAVLKRFMEDAPELIHADAGEWKNSNITPEKKSKAEADLKSAMQAFAIAVDPVQAEQDFVAARDRIYMELYGSNNKSFSALDIADNIIDQARQFRAQYQHSQSAEDLEADFEFTFGEAKTGVRTEANYSWTEKMVKKIMSSPCGRFLNETTLAAAVSIVPMLGQSASSTASRALMGFGAGIAVAGGVAGLKESQAMERDRTEHARAMAAGRGYDASRAPRREELKSSVYEMATAKSAQENLHNLVWENVGGVERKRTLDQNQIDAVMSQLSEIDSRIELSNTEKIDLLSYSDNALVEVERTNLDLERYKTKIELRNFFANNPSLGNFDERLRTAVDARKATLYTESGGINERDSAFKKIKRKNVWKAVGNGAVKGVVFGLVGQELVSLINGQDGLVEGIRGTGSGHGVTSLEWAREKIWGLFGYVKHSDSGVEISIPGKEIISGSAAHEIHNTVNSFLSLPKGYDLNPSGSNPGIYDVIHEGKSIAHVEIDPGTGTPTAASLVELKKAGFDIDTSSSKVVNSATTGGIAGAKSVHVQDFAHEHADKFAKIKRLGWADNGTVRPDRNELKLWDPVEKNGMYQYQVKMNQSGSVFNGQKIDPVKLASEGKLKALFSLSNDTQGHPIEVPIKFEGGKMTFDVDPKDPILGQLFHKAPNGELICDARYVEVAAEMGSKNGVKEFVMCATEEGKGLSSIKETATKVIDSIQTNVKTDISIPSNPDIYLPPVIPLLPRTPLEPTEGKKPIISPYYGYGGFEGNKEDIERWDKIKSTNLARDPKAKLDQEEEVNLYFEKQKEDSEFGEDYLNKIDDRVESIKLKSILNKDTKAVVCMAVHGVSESENIYKTLQLYSKQNAESLKKTAFVLNINWREFENKSDSIKKTIAEVERAKKDFPQLKIAYFTEEMPTELMLRKNNRVHSLLMKNLNDTVLRGIQKNNLKNDIYLISNDADCRGMSSKYLEEIINTTEAEPNKDGFLGKIEWGTEEYKKYPGYHVSMRVMQYLDSVRRNRKSSRERYITSSGANFICKTSTFAAVGGYEPYIGAGADVDLGRKIQHARLAKTSDLESYPISYVNSAWLDTDPQRGLGNYLQGLPMAMMWQDFDKSGYKPRTELSVPAGSEESLEKFEDVVQRIEFQMNSFIKKWQYEEYAYIKALNYLLPPRGGKPAWINKGDSKDPEIKFTDIGKAWLKKQLEDYAKDNKSDIKYEDGRGFRS